MVASTRHVDKGFSGGWCGGGGVEWVRGGEWHRGSDISGDEEQIWFRSENSAKKFPGGGGGGRWSESGGTGESSPEIEGERWRDGGAMAAGVTTVAMVSAVEWKNDEGGVTSVWLCANEEGRRPDLAKTPFETTPIHSPGSSSTPIYSPGASTTPIHSPGSSSTPIYSPGASTTPIYSPGASTTPIYSPGSSSTLIYSPGALRNAECSNCKHLLDKITVLEAMLEMYKNPEQHTLNSAALLHEVYNDMGKLDLE
ncbi:hypothetical protein Tco_1546918 [Tanacetum coccineum]